ncbi:atrial natriuretic peptide receptor 2-like [Antedon mediterranea]|uniref:atrial natriuretic peptide receptor 2-like n=1 Tax=Antedon mediterranea TaxID=105859 RepID=UPI003AF65975
MMLHKCSIWPIIIVLLNDILFCGSNELLVVNIFLPWKSTEKEAYPFLIDRVKHVIPLVESRAATSLGSGHLQINVHDSACDTRQALGKTVECYANSTDIIIGPPCTKPCMSVTDLTSYWNLPSISWFCGDKILFSNKTIYPTFVRIVPPFYKIAILTQNVMTFFEWKRACIITKIGSLYESLANAIQVQGSQENSTFEIISIETYARGISRALASKILKNIKTVCTVIWLIVGGVTIILNSNVLFRAVIWLIVGGVTTNEEDVQMFMLASSDLGMTSGEFVFIHFDLVPELTNMTKRWQTIGPILNQNNERKIRDAFDTLLTITFKLPTDGRIENMNDVQPQAQNPSIMAAYLYDAVILYVNTVSSSLSSHDGYMVGKSLKTTAFEGMTGHVAFDDDGDRISDYVLMDFQDAYRFAPVATFFYLNKSVTSFGTILWPGNIKPGDTVITKSDWWIILVVAVIGVAGIVIIMAVLWLSAKYRKYINRKDWLIKFDDLIPLYHHNLLATTCLPSTVQLHQTSSAGQAEASLSLDVGDLAAELRHGTQTVAIYKAQYVAVLTGQLKNFHLNKVTKKELQALRWLVHDNINRFLGICFPPKDDEMLLYLTEHCSKGTLRVVLDNDDIKLDSTFKMSFINDLTRGLQYIHNSEIKSHGLLTSSLCVIDSRWVLKITGIGTIAHQTYKDNLYKSEPSYRFSRMVWTAPELLRQEIPIKGSQKGDIYSLAIILYEIVSQNNPYAIYEKSPKEVIRLVMKREEPPFRPMKQSHFSEIASDGTLNGLPTELLDFVKQGWEELPEDRPDIHSFRQKLRIVRKGRKESIMDTMLAKMEKYTDNLEKVVLDRTGQLLEEKKKTDELLYRMLPPSVADSLKRGNVVEGEFYQNVTIYFSDIVGFTQISAESNPLEVIDFLNDLYTCFDAIIGKCDVYKVETIGDAYMVASGLPKRNGDRHASEIANMALNILDRVKTFIIRHMPERQLETRIGINSGPIVAGVVGLTMPRYCLFGDTVNTASRMESNGLPQHIHISESTYNILNTIGGYRMDKRGDIKIKGKGSMTTYWLFRSDEEILNSQENIYDAQDEFNKKISTVSEVSNDSLLSPPSRKKPAASFFESHSIPEYPESIKSTRSIPGYIVENDRQSQLLNTQRNN